MKLRVREKQIAIEMRKQGCSYRQIMEKIDVGKGTLSGWLKYLKLTPEQEQSLIERSKIAQDRGRAKTILTNRRKRIERENKARNEAAELFSKHSTDPFFFFGISMYWAEGGKKTQSFQFMNSNPDIITLMLKWIQTYFKIPNDKVFLRLYIHRPYAHENCEQYWGKITGKPPEQFQKTIYKPTPFDIKRNQEYKGCVRIEINAISVYRKMIFLIDILAKHFKNASV